MFEIVFLAFALQASSAEPITARIVSHPDAPAVLIGRPCETAGALVPRKVETQGIDPVDILFGPFHSEEFNCGLMCTLGLAVNDTRHPVAIRLGRVQLMTRGKNSGLISQTLPLRTAEGCDMPLIVAPFSAGRRPPTESFLFYVAEITFSDGTSWRLPDSSSFQDTVTAAWKKESKRQPPQDE